ncbi:MAG: hypothetical protein LPJ89_02285 [Hymenobacteraceae bacterium]|mgnify:CR=1 FL=1|nr:hypothetical protein [Hymenobacteraceae bacterium]MDX5397312.1 hypothetical protein [Hymenobacteraceae bacterium]MDX5442593.1 hypothetical protein [Hymenobacteraceae bacterium]MDX5513390.1 hypothetical protein [Hymenobacteraceae bacterium]
MNRSLCSFLALVLFVVSLLPHADARELNKLPNLFQHFQLHKQQDSANASFAGFLLDHYLNKNHDRGAAEHQDLPYHQEHHNCGSLAYSFPEQIQVKVLPASQAELPPVPATFFIHSSYYNKLFQPPRV